MIATKDSMRAHYLQHVPFEGLGSIEPWLHDAGYDISCTRLYQTGDLPDIDDIDFLVVMGGPMSVNDGQQYPWLGEEIDFIRRAIDSGKPVLGICLGAQLIARSMGAKIYQNPVKEIGWHPVQGLARGSSPQFNFPVSTTVFHWHGETFDLPPGASLIAKSEACENQAFQIGRTVIGLQFHLETTPESAREIVSNCRHELVPSRYVQSEDEILSERGGDYDSIHQRMSEILAYLQPHAG